MTTCPSPVDTYAYWSSDKNKELLQSYFVDWVFRKKRFCQYICSHLPWWCSKRWSARFLTSKNGTIWVEHTLESDHEEADARVLTHISHRTLTSKVSNVVIYSTATDVFVNALYHYQQKWKRVELEELYNSFGVGKPLMAEFHFFLAALPFL